MNIPMVLPSSPTKIWGKSVIGFLSYDRTYWHTNKSKQRLLLYFHRLRFLQIKLLLGAINGSLSAEIPFVLMHPSPRDRWGWDGTPSPKDRWGWDGIHPLRRIGEDGIAHRSQEIGEGGMAHCPPEKVEGWMAQLPWTSSG